jgi:CHAD domain-containing protein
MSPVCLDLVVLFVRSHCKTIEPGLKKLDRQNRTWMKRALSSDKDEDFHEWRKGVKYYFYLLKMLAPMWPSRLRKTVKHLDCLQCKLGKYHDLAVLKSFLVKHLSDPGRQDTGAAGRPIPGETECEVSEAKHGSWQDTEG